MKYVFRQFLKGRAFSIHRLITERATPVRAPVLCYKPIISTICMHSKDVSSDEVPWVCMAIFKCDCKSATYPLGL